MKTQKRYCSGDLLNENRVDLYRQYTDDDGEECTEEAHSDGTSDTYTLFMKNELYTRRKTGVYRTENVISKTRFLL